MLPRWPKLPLFVNRLGNTILEDTMLEEIRKATIKEAEPLPQKTKKHDEKSAVVQI